MEVILVIGIVVITIILYKISKANEPFIKPSTLDNKTLLGSIAGQADWLDKMVRSDWEIQGKKSIMEIATKRRAYLATLCQEVLSRELFEEAAEYAKELESTGVPKEKAAIRAVREKLFKANGIHYLATWEEGEPNIDAMYRP